MKWDFMAGDLPHSPEALLIQSANHKIPTKTPKVPTHNTDKST